MNEEQKAFYLGKFRKYGDSPQALSYNSRASQNLRFKILAQLFQYETGGEFSVHEVGCGLAHFKTYLDQEGVACEYSGSDLCEEFVAASRAKYPGVPFRVEDINRDIGAIDAEVKGKDYYVVSGTFNPRGAAPVQEWERFVFKAVANMFAMCRKGAAFNVLTSYSDYYDPGLYYADPKAVYDWCRRKLSRFITVVSDGPLFEFTVLVYKESFIRSLYPAEFSKYFK